MKNHKAIFSAVEATLLSVGSRNITVGQIQRELNKYKGLEGTRFSDAEHFWVMVYVIFYSGFRAATVTARQEVIRKHLSDYKAVASYGEQEINLILRDPGMIRNRRKIEACIANARTFNLIISERGSFQNYVDSFAASASHENLLKLKGALQERFIGLGPVTTYHFLTDIGLPVLKPDRVMCRVFERLGLVDRRDDYEGVVRQGTEFARQTGYPIRYIDIVFVAFGQMESREFGLEKRICLERSPPCSLCLATSHCKYYARLGAEANQ